MVKKFAYCLTINNPTEDDWLPFKDIDGTECPREWTSFSDVEVDRMYSQPKEHPKNKEYPKKASFKEKHPLMYKNYIQYIIYGNEKSKAGTKHYQMFIVFRRPVSFRFCKRLFGRAHIEPARGSFDEASQYCKKQGSYYSYGYDIDKAKSLVELDNEIQTSIREELDLKQRIDIIDKKLELIYNFILKENNLL